MPPICEHHIVSVLSDYGLPKTVEFQLRPDAAGRLETSRFYDLFAGLPQVLCVTLEIDNIRLNHLPSKQQGISILLGDKCGPNARLPSYKAGTTCNWAT
jgi:hypothetical protein